MRRWSGLCYGIGTLLVAIGPLLSSLDRVVIMRELTMWRGDPGTAPPSDDVVDAIVEWSRTPGVWSWVSVAAGLGVTLLLVGLVLWIREARAVRRADLPKRVGAAEAFE